VTTQTDLIIDVRSDELHLGDVLDEGIEITELHVQDNGWVRVVSNISASSEPPARIHRVMRAENRLGLTQDDPVGTDVYDNCSSLDESHGRRVAMWGDMKTWPIP
jgi:hypothetical protein